MSARIFVQVDRVRKQYCVFRRATLVWTSTDDGYPPSIAFPARQRSPWPTPKACRRRASRSTGLRSSMWVAIAQTTGTDLSLHLAVTQNWSRIGIATEQSALRIFVQA